MIPGAAPRVNRQQCKHTYTIACDILLALPFNKSPQILQIVQLSRRTERELTASSHTRGRLFAPPFAAYANSCLSERERTPARFCDQIKLSDLFSLSALLYIHIHTQTHARTHTPTAVEMSRIVACCHPIRPPATHTQIPSNSQRAGTADRMQPRVHHFS